MSERAWPWATLGEIATVTAGNPAPQGAQFFEGGSRPFVRVQDLGRLNGAAHLTETADLVNESAAGALKLFPKGSVLFTKSGASLLLNQRAILSRDMHVVSHIGIAVPGPRITSEWLYYWLRTVDFADIAHGANMPSLPLARVKQVRVPVPPVPEQRRRVAEIEKQFSRLDEAVANLKRVKANLKHYKASVLKAAVEGSLAPTEADLARREECAFESASDLLARILDSGESKTSDSARPQEALKSLGTASTPLPEGWGWAECDQLLAGIEAGASFKCVERPPLLGETGVLKVSAVTWGEFDEEESKTCVDLSRVREDFLVKPGDFLFSRANTIELVGACVIVRSVTKRLMLSDKTLRFRLRPFVLPEWLLACLRSEHGRGEITRLATGNQESMRNIGQDRIRRIRIPMPPLAEQRRILAELDRRLSTIDPVERTLNASFTRVQHLRQAALAHQFGAAAGEVA